MSSDLYFISDLHFGHDKPFVYKSRGHDNIVDHDEWLIDSINSVVGKRDSLFILGDVCFGVDHLKKIDLLTPQYKTLIIGNHDKYKLSAYQHRFTKIHGFMRRDNYWLSHCPIHPIELRGKKNIHGHVHNSSIPDSNYINVSVDACDGVPVKLSDIKDGKYETYNRN